MGGQDITYNSQLVSYLFALHQLHNAETGTEDAFTLYHLVQESPDAPTSRTYGPALPALGHALAGGIATASAKVLLYPLELVTTRLQVQRQLAGPKEAPSAAKDADAEYTSVIDAAKKIYKHEGGLKPFYTGCLPDVGKGIADSFLFFLAYTYIRQRQLRRDNTTNLSVIKELSVGIAAGAFAKLVTTPIQNIVTRQQTAALVAARDPGSTTSPAQSDRLSMRDVAKQIRAERGLAGFWAGYSASIILTLNPAITFAVDNLLRRLLPKSARENRRPYLTFLIAAISKAIATTLTYPVMLAKSRAQAASSTTATEIDKSEKQSLKTDEHSSDSETATAHRTINQKADRALRLLSAQYRVLLSLQHIYHTEGLSGLYSGLDGEVLKGFLSHGLTMTVKDRVHVAVVELYYLLLKLTRRWPADAQAVAVDAKERAENVGVTVSEGAKQLVEEGRKAVGGEK